MPRGATRRERVLALFLPDKSGRSRWVLVSEFAAAGLPWTKNGNLRHGVAFGVDDVKWEARRAGGERSAVEALRMAGWDKAKKFSQAISAEVRSHFESVTTCNLSRLPVSERDREIDHRYGHKTHPDYVSAYSTKPQNSSDFQVIHRALNLLKRQICVKCISTRERPPHPDLGFVEGSSRHSARFPCRGCYLAEPERYRLSKAR
jgi:hypothetical protein